MIQLNSIAMKNKTIHLHWRRYPFHWYIYKQSRSWHLFLFYTTKVDFMPLCTYQAINVNTIQYNLLAILSESVLKSSNIESITLLVTYGISKSMTKHNNYVRAFISNGTTCILLLIWSVDNHPSATLDESKWHQYMHRASFP